MLFALRDTAAIPFGKALEYANEATAKTGVRPAFLLAVLTQESNLGENVGTCNRPSDPPAKKWRVIMKPARDHQPFLRITSALGLDPDNLPLSCPWQGSYGGAMGPAQFIPSTWELFQPRIAAALDKAVPNPWEPRDAFMAAAIYLSDLGAASQSYSAERNAACRYYSGRACGVGKPANTFYGNEVMAEAENIQLNLIDPLREV
jgi:membrane-bound lytic murein transglycosylase B